MGVDSRDLRLGVLVPLCRNNEGLTGLVTDWYAEIESAVEGGNGRVSEVEVYVEDEEDNVSSNDDWDPGYGISVGQSQSVRLCNCYCCA